MEIKTTRDLGVWFTNIRECKNDVIMSNPINLKYLHKSWVSVDSLIPILEEHYENIRKLIEELRK